MTHVLLRDVDDADLEMFYEQQREEEAVRRAQFPARDRDRFLIHWWQSSAKYQLDVGGAPRYRSQLPRLARADTGTGRGRSQPNARLPPTGAERAGEAGETLMHSRHDASGRDDGRRVQAVSAADHPRRPATHMSPECVPLEELERALLRCACPLGPRSGEVLMCNAFLWPERARYPRVADKLVVDR
jgi:hypothetical protein